MRTFCLNRKGSKIGIIAVVMAMGVTLGLTACNNGSSSASDEDYEQSSSSDEDYEQSASSVACSEVHEGQVYTVSPNNPKYEPVTYKKCKNGTWVSVPEASAKCEMENIQIGDTCSYEVSGSYMSSSHGITYCSVEVYQGDDLWKSVHYGLCDTLTVEK